MMMTTMTEVIDAAGAPPSRGAGRVASLLLLLLLLL